MTSVSKASLDELISKWKQARDKCVSQAPPAPGGDAKAAFDAGKSEGLAYGMAAGRASCADELAQLIKLLAS